MTPWYRDQYRREFGKIYRLSVLLVLASCAGVEVDAEVEAGAAAAAPDHGPKTENVLLVTLDGVRWQEVFGGADRTLMNDDHGGVRARALPDLRRDFWRGSATDRRARLMPFFWRVIATDGQVFGDPERDSVARAQNGHNFSYPGYHEILCGYPDERIDSNAKRPNPNQTLLEWLNARPAYADRVAAFASWDVFPYIINEQRSGVFVSAGWEDLEPAGAQQAELLNDLAGSLPHYWQNVRYDAFTFQAAIGYVRQHHPRVIYVSFGESDDWAHDKRYDLYLRSTLGADRLIERLWHALQSMPEYAGTTSLVLTTDHGRGAGLDDWVGHGADVTGSDRIWIAVLGPDTPPLGLREGIDVTQSQIAATVAEVLGEPYRDEVERAAPPLPGVTGR